ncbi:hypothetical protein COW91_00210 [Candidatus Nomurabacteria bacterium CG22_combo_CG10-13_8_21_14_all_32_8]|uniref:Saccharopine dehydrogenase NADP binding domain-containing protein n=1 Tax=Candidatus Nomurabacteria bacterium CG22_combo_CG10-13_8_21_14_all_32_8 TaxID=1974732 RepID=A0A2H0CHC7_9BACT|nr:MAG: hypothetical protein COW91_00210 [Candidatus Nomurabacteria bacterium CG22_combo_CG10-13_8_21_14_all_32_8]
MKTMKILNIGNGKVGSVLCKLLLKEEKIKAIICCDLQIKNKIKNKKITYKKINAGNSKEVINLLKKEKPDIVINNSLPIFNENILKCCLKCKINYIDLASYWDYTPNSKTALYEVEQLKFNEKFIKNKLTGLINAGVSPGLTNLLARECSEHLDKTNEIRIRLLEDTKTDKLCFAWSKEWLLDEIATKPLVYKNNKFELGRCFGEEERFEFPGDNGIKNVCLIAQEEIGTIPLYIKTKHINIKMYDNQVEMSKFMHKLDLISKKEIQIGKEKISPLQFMTRILPDTPDMHKFSSFDEAVFGLVVEAEGKKSNKNHQISYSVMFPSQKEVNKLKLDASFIAYATALMTKFFILSFDKIKQFGVFPPENLNETVRHYIIDSLKKDKSINILYKSEVLATPFKNTLK